MDNYINNLEEILAYITQLFYSEIDKVSGRISEQQARTIFYSMLHEKADFIAAAVATDTWSQIAQSIQHLFIEDLNESNHFRSSDQVQS